jgi:hypothetical protein
MKTLLTAVATLGIILLMSVSVSSQTVGPKYDAAAEVTIQGKVLSVHNRQCPVSGTLGAHFMLEGINGKVYEVHLAPATFTRSFDIDFVVGEKVDVTGSVLVFEGKDAILARQVKHGNETVTFRDKKGDPAWN